MAGCAALVKDGKQNNIGQRMSDHQSCELVVDNTVDGKDNLEEKTRGVADVRMQHFSCNFLNMAGCTGEGFITSTTIYRPRDV